MWSEGGGGGGGWLGWVGGWGFEKGCCSPPLSPASSLRCPLEAAGGEVADEKGPQEKGLRSGHMSANGAHAGPFQAVTVNLFDLSLCKSLGRLKASLLDCGGGTWGRLPLPFVPRLPV